MHLHIAVVEILRGNFDRHAADVVSNYFFPSRALSAFPCCGCLGISPCWMCGADCWPVSESGTETDILASDLSSESPRPP